jgi:uncharacterized protein (TIGR01777 family)
VGRSLLPVLSAGGHEVRALSRGSAGGSEIAWNVASGEIDHAALDQWGTLDAVIHLAGENIAARRWSAEQKRRIVESRVQATQRLVAHLSRRKPRLYIGASAVGYYGDRGDEILTEESPGGTGFLADTCEAWEQATAGLTLAGVKVVHLRFGMILGADGGALAKMLPIFRAGLGGKLGSGRQWISWISLQDAVRVVEYCLTRRDISGAYNAVAPNPVRNSEFIAMLAQVLKRPAIFPAPAFALKILYGEMAEGLLLSSQRVLPDRLERAGFDFEHPQLFRAFKAVLSGAVKKN